MKKLLLSAFCAIGLFAMSSNAYAQLLSDIEGMPPYKLGVTAGFNASSFSASGADAKAGFNLGADLMLDASDLIPDTYLRINLLLQRKGTVLEKEHNQASSLHKTKIRTIYLEIPLDYGYAYRIDKNVTLLGEMGPYFAFGLGGKYNYELVNKKKEKVSYFGSDTMGNPKRFDVGWGFAAGTLIGNVHQIKVGYEFGFIDMSDSMKQNRNFMIGYSYFFE